MPHSIAGRIYRNGKLTPGILHIRDGIITKIAKSDTCSDHTDFGDKAILPGALDIHVHFREPGLTHKEDLRTGSISAAYGGVTGFVDMPNTLPATTNTPSLKDKHKRASKKSVVDYGFWAGASWYLGDLDEMLKLACGVKVYLGATTGDLLFDELENLPELLHIAGKAGKPVILHCEAQRVLESMRKLTNDLQDHNQQRASIAEVEAIYDVMKSLHKVKKKPKIHIAHVASPEALKAATSGGFSTGICPHHFLLDTESDLPHAFGKVNPPLRNPPAREALFAALAAGEIPIVESDHAPHERGEKEAAFNKAPSGMPGVETMVPLLLNEVKQDRIPLQRAIDAVTEAPAHLLGLTDRGTLDKGMRADFAVYDLDKATKIDEERLHSKAGWSCYNGMDAIFPSHVALAGEWVIDDGELQDVQGRSLIPV